MIEINNLTAISVQKYFIKGITRKVLKEENKKKAGLSIVLMDSDQMKKLNKKYLKRNRATDVLTFGQSKEFPITPESKAHLGEIVICPQEVEKNAKFHSSSFKKELARALIHGILHLLGYKHRIPRGKAEAMGKKEKYYLEKFFQ